MFRFTKHCLIALLAVAAAVPWAARPAGAIAHGAVVRDGDYRFSVLLTMTGLPETGGGTRDSSCSGALIAPRWVITAGHCFRDAAGRRVSRTVADRTTAVVGRADLTGHAGHEIEVIAAHQADDTDVALAELAEPITDVPPLRPATTPPRVGEVLRLTGFGLVTRGGAKTPATRLHTGEFTVDAFGDTLLEASGREPRPDTSPCPHDSGGPYFRTLPGGAAELVSVVSTGPDCPHRGPDLSARIDTLTAWIADTTADHPRTVTPTAWTAAAGVPLCLLALYMIRRHRQRVRASARLGSG